MSRSYRKPWVTDKPRPGVKREASHTVRRTKDVPSGKAYRKFFNPWDIRDWRWYDPKNKKASRK